MTLFGHGGLVTPCDVSQEDLRCVVVGRRVHEGGENSVVRVFCDRYCIEASSCGRIDLEDSTPGWFRGGAMSGSGMSALGDVFSQKVVRTCSSVLPSKLEPRQVWGEETQ